MATKAVLAELARAYEARSGRTVAIESVGGVDAAERVRAGEPFDVVVLARDAIDKLLAGESPRRRQRGRSAALGRRGRGARRRARDRRSAARTRSGARCWRRARSASPPARAASSSAGCSSAGASPSRSGTGSSRRRPAFPWAALVARGEVELGFQQLSELLHLEGIDVLGPLPPAIQIVTTFSAAVGARARQPEAARALLAFMASPAAADDEAAPRHGPGDVTPRPEHRA